MATIDEMLAGEGAGGFQDVIATDGGGAGEAEAPKRKEVANYRPADDPSQSCETCANFVPPEGCTKVLGQISATGTSDLWEPAQAEELLDSGVEDFLYGGGGI